MCVCVLGGGPRAPQGTARGLRAEARFLRGIRGAFGSQGLFTVTWQGEGFAEPRGSARELEKPGRDGDSARLQEELQRRGDQEGDRRSPGETEAQRQGGKPLAEAGGGREEQSPRQSSGESEPEPGRPRAGDASLAGTQEQLKQ